MSDLDASKRQSWLLFTSDREQRLWGWTLAVVVAVYSTLGLARTLVGVLDDSVMGAGFFICMLLVGVMVLTQGLKVRPGGVEIAVALGVGVAYVLVAIRMALPAERSHLLEYSVVALLIYEALTERASQSRRVPVPALLAILATSLIGVLDESIQAFLPSRVFDPLDMLQNSAAAVAAVTPCAALRWTRRLAMQLRRQRT